MGKDIKEKYERVCAVKDRAISLVEAQMNGNIENVDAKELGEVADIAKDFAEIMKLCAEAEYYCKVTDAMDEGSDEEKKYYMNKYIPEYEGKFYSPVATNGDMNMARRRDSRGRYMYHDDFYPDWSVPPMYYTEPDGMHYSNKSDSMTNMNYARDMREGRSGITRRTYMDMKDADKNTKMEKFKEYIDNFQEDMEEMFVEGKSTPEEKAYAKQALAKFISKL